MEASVRTKELRIVLLVALLLAGCAAPKAKHVSKQVEKPKKEESSEPDQVTTEAGDLTYRPPSSNGKPLWKVSWRRAELRMAENRKLGGTVYGLTGTLYGKEGPSSNFSAQSGVADQNTGNLTLTGNVVVNSIEQKATLRCAQVVYASNGQRQIRAHGDVHVNGPWGTVSGLEDVLTTPDLKTFATPDLFPQS